MVKLNCKIRLFADDCLIYREIELLTGYILLQKGIDENVQWADLNKMELNTGKTNLIRFHRCKHVLQWSYMLNGSLLVEKYDCKYLGVTLTKDLQWGTHISNIVSKGYKALHFIMRVLGKGSLNSKEVAYKSLVRPILEYSATVWNPQAIGLLKEVEMAQRTAARYVKNNFKRTASVTEMLEKLG
jgi:hypothetical protein